MNTVTIDEAIFEDLTAYARLHNEPIKELVMKSVKAFLDLARSNNTKVTPYRSRYSELTDEELEARLQGLPSLDDVDHSDLDQIDYAQYHSFESPKIKQIVAKWL